MIGLVFFICAVAVVLVMGGIHLLLQGEGTGEESSHSPLESGFVSTGSVCSLFSLQLFTILVLLLILDLEVVLVVSFMLSSLGGKMLSLWFILFVLCSLWAEWSWGKLSWSL